MARAFFINEITLCRQLGILEAVRLQPATNQQFTSMLNTRIALSPLNIFISTYTGIYTHIFATKIVYRYSYMYTLTNIL